jgi:hypothetical protein
VATFVCAARKVAVLVTRGNEGGCFAQVCARAEMKVGVLLRFARPGRRVSLVTFSVTRVGVLLTLITITRKVSAVPVRKIRPSSGQRRDAGNISQER